MSRYFEDNVFPTQYLKKNPKLWVYPIYLNSFKLDDSVCISLSFPYSMMKNRLLTMLHQNCRIKLIRVNIPELQKRIEKDSDPNSSGRVAPERVVLRGGRFPLKVSDSSSDVNSVVLTGRDVLSSTIYTSLKEGKVDGNKYVLSDAVAKISYHRGGVAGVVTKIDKRGNYIFRPGIFGSNAGKFSQFLNFCSDNMLLEDLKMNIIGEEIKLSE